jgi:hypothetical protein
MTGGTLKMGSEKPDRCVTGFEISQPRVKDKRRRGQIGNGRAKAKPNRKREDR